MINNYSSSPVVKLGNGIDRLNEIINEPEHRTFSAFVETLEHDFGDLLGHNLPKAAQRKTMKSRRGTKCTM